MIHLQDPDGPAIREVVTRLLENVRSVAALARTLHKSRGTLYKWQAGTSHPSIEELCSLAHALGEHVRIDMGPTDEADEQEDVTTLLGRVLANQERQIRMLRDALSRP